MNYPIKVKKVFSRIRYSAQDLWQNLKELKRSISCLERNIDDMNACVMRSRQIVRGCGQEPLHEPLSGWRPQADGRTHWASVPQGEKL